MSSSGTTVLLTTGSVELMVDQLELYSDNTCSILILMSLSWQMTHVYEANLTGRVKETGSKPQFLQYVRGAFNRSGPSWWCDCKARGSESSSRLQLACCWLVTGWYKLLNKWLHHPLWASGELKNQPATFQPRVSANICISVSHCNSAGNTSQRSTERCKMSRQNKQNLH